MLVLGSGHNQLMAGAPFASISDLSTACYAKPDIIAIGKGNLHVEEGYILAESLFITLPRFSVHRIVGRRSSEHFRSKYPLFLSRGEKTLKSRGMLFTARI